MRKIDFLEDPLVREEIERYKWIESEKRGVDIGWTEASREWVLRHAIAWCKAHPVRKYPLKKAVVEGKPRKRS